MSRDDEKWIDRMREAYEAHAREVPPDVAQALARARNRALHEPARRLPRPVFFIPALALAASLTLAIFFWIRLPAPRAPSPELAGATQMLARGSPKLYEHLAFYRWLAEHPTRKDG